MNRFRVALVAVLLALVAVVVLTVLHPPAPPAVSGAGSAGVVPVSERAQAPDFTGIDAWINSTPLTMTSLRGHVVLVDFWTFSCVNCVRTLPHLHALAAAYARSGLVVVGVHSPEFDFEKPVANVRAAVQRLDVTWPVAVDSQMATWNAYGNQYWPAEYIVDTSGRIADVVVGEGQDAGVDSAVAQLLGVRASPVPVPTAVPSNITPELYAGSSRGQLADGEQYGPPGDAVTYPDQGPPQTPDAIQVTGTWRDEGEYLEAVSAATVRVNVLADHVYVVAGAAAGALDVRVYLDDRLVAPRFAAADVDDGVLTITRQDLYPLLQSLDAGRHLVELRVPAGFRLYTFTFG